MRKLILIISTLSFIYSQCDETNWQEYYPELSGCYLVEADLWNVDFSGANLSYANLSSANLSSANLIEAILIEAILIETYLSGANLLYADLSGANLYEANLYESNLYGANLYGANLTDAYLSVANLEGACLEGVIGFTQSNYIGNPIFEGCRECGSDGSSCQTLGDLNADGTFNVVDVVLLVNAVMDWTYNPLGDMNVDGVNNVVDVVALRLIALRRVVGVLTLLQARLRSASRASIGIYIGIYI